LEELLRKLTLEERPKNLGGWARLFSVALADVYVRLCSMGAITDLRIL